MYFSILNSARIKIKHNIAPVNSFISSICVSQHSNVCPILTDLDS